ncbi:hypothetical protein GOP47_0006297 [Adiantum capillus-veneris]|uniref:Uncharacterized protein n=1 Tax=Adiantum capillus-veneris TaxID=13818 RepID=A0A9D4ZMD3_ADICA|nr:hypothetical protein GOP47_0006297 [Adiantum capillus-veneris]
MLKTVKQKTGWLACLLVAFLLLATIAEKARHLVGEDAASRSGQFTWINCFDMGTGSLACLAKEGVKSYVYNIRAGHIARVKQRSFEIAYANALAEGKAAQVASKDAKTAGNKAEKLASRKARRILGPFSAAAWDMFEALYYGGTMFEATMRGLGTIGGTYWGSLQGEANLGRVGYLIGSHLGSWIGGRVGLMLYDIAVGVHFLVNENFVETPSVYVDDTGSYETSTEGENNIEL